MWCWRSLEEPVHVGRHQQTRRKRICLFLLIHFVSLTWLQRNQLFVVFYPLHSHCLISTRTGWRTWLRKDFTETIRIMEGPQLRLHSIFRSAWSRRLVAEDQALILLMDFFLTAVSAVLLAQSHNLLFHRAVHMLTPMTAEGAGREVEQAACWSEGWWLNSRLLQSARQVALIGVRVWTCDVS